VAAVLPGARPFYGHLIDATRHLKSKYMTVPVSACVREDLAIWMLFLQQWNGRAPWTTHHPFVFEHDASGGGFGFTLASVPAGFDVEALPVELRPGHGFAGTFSDEHRHVAKNIQWGELFAIVASVALYAPLLQGHSFHLITDNQPDRDIVRRQHTNVATLRMLLRQLYITCAHHNITITIDHIPGHTNTIPDFLSRPKLHLFRKHKFFAELNTHIHIHHILSSAVKHAPAGHLPSMMTWPPSFP
jgi:hypothetical protein